MTTKIEWCEESWNPITGCTPISEGCQNCYAKRMANRLQGRYGYPDDDPFRVTFHPDRLEQPLKWKKPRMIFVCSMSDLFHEKVGLPQILMVIDIMMECQRHKFLILTKRPNEMRGIINWLNLHRRWQFKNASHIWLGITAENKKRYHERWAILQTISARIKFVSIEPMLNHININQFLEKPDWVICGAETGPKARYMNPDWARGLRDQCQAAGVPFFMKKMSNNEPIPDDLNIREYPK